MTTPVLDRETDPETSERESHVASCQGNDDVKASAWGGRRKGVIFLKLRGLEERPSGAETQTPLKLVLMSLQWYHNPTLQVLEKLQN